LLIEQVAFFALITRPARFLLITGRLFIITAFTLLSKATSTALGYFLGLFFSLFLPWE